MKPLTRSRAIADLVGVALLFGIAVALALWLFL